MTQKCRAAIVGSRSRDPTPNVPGRVKDAIVTTPDKTTLFTLLGDYPNTAALKRGDIASDLVALEFADVKVANTGFKPLVRDAKFDLGELAIVTYLQAKAYGKPYVLMPLPIMVRGQHHTIAYNPERGRLTPSDLPGKRIGTRAYSVTTGVWIRGILRQQYGVDLDQVQWITFEEPHVAEYVDPPAVHRAPASKTMAQMLLDGELDAAIVGDKLPDPRLALLFPDHEAAAAAWAAEHGQPINHLAVIRTELSRRRPEVVREVFRMFKASCERAVEAGDKNAAHLRFGIEPNRRALASIIDIAARDGLIPRRWEVDELFDDVTRSLA
jgi:4,5-dihydroxyphthalate decarboxylase